MLPITEIQLNKLLGNAHFRAFANDLGKLRPTRYGANQAGKRARSLFNCFFVTDGMQINEQNISTRIGPLYLQTEFEAI